MNEELIKEYYENNPEGLPGIPEIPEVYECHQYFINRISKENPAKLLDAGCGKGYLGSTLAPYTNEYYGYDISESAISQAKMKIGRGKFFVGSLRNIPFTDNYFDCVVCSEVLEHIPDYQKAIRELSRVLKKGGKLFISTPNKMNPDMIWQTFWKGKYTSQVYDKPIYYRKLLRECTKSNLLILESYSFFFLPIGGSSLPNYILEPLMKLQKFISRITSLPLGLYLFIVAQKI